MKQADCIWKFTLSPSEKQSFDLPVGAHILDVQTQGNEICMWVHGKFPTDETAVTRYFSVYPTGVPLPDVPKAFIATVQYEWMVFHVYELLDDSDKK